MSSSLNRGLDWLATSATVAGVFGALIAGEVEQRLLIPFGHDPHQRAVSRMARWINRATRLCGTRMRIEGKEHLRPGQNYIIVSNHQSLLDISMASDFLEALQPKYISKKELAHGIPGVSFNLRRGGSACIDRKDPAQAHAAIELMAKRVRENGWTVMIFPEGTRSKTGEMRPFRAGGLQTLLEHAPGVPVLPVTTSGGSKLFSTNLKPIVRNVELVFRVHAPMMPPDVKDEAALKAFIADVEKTIASGLPR